MIKPKPFTKWVGGKRQLLPVINANLPKEYNNYFEPFIGGGALLFNLLPASAVINDYNEDLIKCYIAIRDDLDTLIDYLKVHDENNTKEYYLEIREYDRNGKLEEMGDTWVASRLMYMLRVNFNGMYRVNSKGQFNVPYGKYVNPRIVDVENLTAVSKYLNNNDVTIVSGDFEQAVSNAEEGDFVYFDPPYIPLDVTSSFTAYTMNGFNYDEQVRLRDLFVKLTAKGVKCMLSNSSAELTYDLYNGYDFKIQEVDAIRAINSNGAKRGAIKELLITNY